MDSAPAYRARNNVHLFIGLTQTTEFIDYVHCVDRVFILSYLPNFTHIGAGKIKGPSLWFYLCHDSRPTLS